MDVIGLYQATVEGESQNFIGGRFHVKKMTFETFRFADGWVPLLDQTLFMTAHLVRASSSATMAIQLTRSEMVPIPAETDPPESVTMGDEIRQLLDLGSAILRHANREMEEHLSKTLEDFRSNRLESWQLLYKTLCEKYGDQVGGLEKNAATHLSNFLDKCSAENRGD